jgi:hypothetical protein
MKTGGNRRLPGSNERNKEIKEHGFKKKEHSNKRVYKRQ